MNMISFRSLLLFVAIFALVGVYGLSLAPEDKSGSTEQYVELTVPNTGGSPQSELSEPEQEEVEHQPPPEVTTNIPYETKIPTINIPTAPIIKTLDIAPTERSVDTFASINMKTRESIVNILCTSEYGGLFRPISGSGIIIDPRGVILTNAHVAQYTLLKDYLFEDFMKCIARIGSPARATYTITPLYIPQHWIEKHAKQIDAENPSGTGESDYALLLITGRTDPFLSANKSLQFLSIQTDNDLIAIGEKVLVAGYPAGFLGGIATQKDLYLTSTVTTIMQEFTFNQNTNKVDLISLGGSVVAQKGSSGGAVVNTKGELIALVVTSTDAETTDKRDLRATTLGHINRDLILHNGTTLSAFLSGDLGVKADTFNNTIASTLTDLLVNAIND
jgi:hypothetical protein